MLFRSVANKNVLDDYCKWLFRLLFRIEEINNLDGKKEPNRYLGSASINSISMRIL